jgi:two-component system chemotaxis sensor kinase CheA
VTNPFDSDHFIAGFIAEAEEHLSAANTHLLAIEQPAARGEATPRQVRELFRAFHTVKGLAAMVGIDAIVDISHAMEAVLREADRASGKLPAGAVELLLQGVGAIEQRVRALAKNKPVRKAPPELVAALNGLRQGGSEGQAGPSARATVPPELWAKLGPAEREQVVQGLRAGRRGVLIQFTPTPERAAAGVNVTSVRERVAAIAELVKVIPRSVPTSAEAPGGLAFALIVLAVAPDAELAAAADVGTDALTAFTLEEAAPEASATGLDEQLTDEELQRRGFVRVEVSRLDDALERLSALVVTQFRLTRAAADLRQTGADTRALGHVITENARQLRDLRAAIMRARMVSVAELLERVPLIVRGLSRATGKAARLEIVAGHAELDKAVAERVFPAIVHLVRNAVDHALETPAERRAAGKPETGVVTVACVERADNQLELTVTDDGRGIDAQSVARKAGVAVPATAEALLELLARPGLSTKAEVTTTSGRGVGMDVVKRIAVDDLHGDLTLTTSPGQGTTFSLRIPLSITIVDAFSFVCGGETFVVPVSTVEEIQEVDLTHTVRGPDRRKAPRGEPDRRRSKSGAQMMQRRGEAVPVLRLDELFGLPAPDEGRRKAIIVRRNGEPYAFAVDRMLGQQEVVVRPIEDALVRVHGVAGTTDLGDGRPTLVLDLIALGGGLAGAAGEASP